VFIYSGKIYIQCNNTVAKLIADPFFPYLRYDTETKQEAALRAKHQAMIEEHEMSSLRSRKSSTIRSTQSLTFNEAAAAINPGFTETSFTQG